MKKIGVILLFLIFSLVGFYSLIFFNFGIINANNDKQDKIINFKSVFSKNIYLDSIDLNSTILMYKTNSDISNFSIHSICNIDYNFLKSIENIYFFNVVFLDNNCNNPYIYLKNNDYIVNNSQLTVNLNKKSDLLLKYIDFSSSNLIEFNKKIDKNIKELSLFKNIVDFNSEDELSYYKKLFLYKELIYNKIIIDYILDKREKKYISPVKGYNISNQHSKIPNSKRSYREDYTDGIHHGWDIDAPLGTEVIALDDGVIIRDTRNFLYEDLNKIKYRDNLTYEEQLENLDILRGKQVWLKTLKGDVVFYSHLSEVYENIKVGDYIKVGTPLGKIGITGIPDKDYKDYHLHFAIQKNPYNLSKIGNYSFLDYMKWDWYFKGESLENIVKEQINVFEI